jgi:hypothetical protein
MEDNKVLDDMTGDIGDDIRGHDHDNNSGDDVLSAYMHPRASQNMHVQRAGKKIYCFF